MKITHHVNSWFEISFDDTKTIIWTDPWNCGANLEGIFPIFTVPYKKFKTPDYVFISHIHDDHYDKNIISYLPDNTKFIINNFEDNLLKKFLISFGVSESNLIVIDPWAEFELEDNLKFLIVPQVQSNLDDISSEADYDMDTAVFIKYKDQCFFNQVDMCLNQDYLSQVYSKAKSILNFNKINLYSRVFGGGSEYPQCFLNINRKEESRRIKNSCLEDFCKSTLVIKPDYIVPAGASYQLSNDRKILEKYIAVPSNYELAEFWENDINKFKNTILALTEGGGMINLLEIPPMDNLSINIGSKYELFKVKNPKFKESKIINEKTEKILLKSFEDLISSLSKQNFITSSIQIVLCKNSKSMQQIVEEGITNNKNLLKYNHNFINSSVNKLTIYFEIENYIKWINGKVNFNNLSCGSHLMFEREGEFDWEFYTYLCRYKSKNEILI